MRKLHLLLRIKNKFGSGGIATKLDAAKICMNSGSHMFIANGKVNNPILNMIKNKRYTHFLPKISTLDARKNGSSVLLVIWHHLY